MSNFQFVLFFGVILNIVSAVILASDRRFAEAAVFGFLAVGFLFLCRPWEEEK